MTTCQHFVSGSQATGIDKDACSKRASHTEIVDLWYRWGELGGVPMTTIGSTCGRTP